MVTTRSSATIPPTITPTITNNITTRHVPIRQITTTRLPDFTTTISITTRITKWTKWVGGEIVEDNIIPTLPPLLINLYPMNREIVATTRPPPPHALWEEVVVTIMLELLISTAIIKIVTITVITKGILVGKRVEKVASSITEEWLGRIVTLTKIITTNNTTQMPTFPRTDTTRVVPDTRCLPLSPIMRIQIHPSQTTCLSTTIVIITISIIIITIPAITTTPRSEGSLWSRTFLKGTPTPSLSSVLVVVLLVLITIKSKLPVLWEEEEAVHLPNSSNKLPTVRQPHPRLPPPHRP